MARLPSLPKLIHRKIYKTGQTRGADNDQIYQNRVGRNSTALIPFSVWDTNQFVREQDYENGYTVLITPNEFFEDNEKYNARSDLKLGDNLLVFYEQRQDWLEFNPFERGYTEACSRRSPLGGQFVARIANTTATGDKRINTGYTTKGLKGAGIRQYEYAPISIIKQCRIQLEALFWCCVDADEKMLRAGMSIENISIRRSAITDKAKQLNLIDKDLLIQSRIINEDNELICPLCKEPISSAGFLSRLPQATGRERHDLTVTEINLFHIEELSYGTLNHRPYNLGWGHHHCNIVCKDAGIGKTLDWMHSVLKRNDLLLRE